MCNLYDLRAEWVALVEGLRDGYGLDLVADDGARTWLDLSADPSALYRAPPAGALTADPLEPAAA